MVITSRLRVDLLQAGPLKAYAGTLLEQDTRSNDVVVYNDNGVSPLIGASLPLILPELAVFTEYRQTFRLFNKPNSKASSQPDILLGSYGYRYWPLASPAQKTSLFEEVYGDFIARSKLSFDPTFESWSKTGARWTMGGGFSADTYVDLEFRRGATGEREDNFQTLGPGLRLNYGTHSYSIAISAHEELGSYSSRSESISRWKGLFVLSGAF
jgi:hypothetical protein